MNGGAYRRRSFTVGYTPYSTYSVKGCCEEMVKKDHHYFIRERLPSFIDESQQLRLAETSKPNQL